MTRDRRTSDPRAADLLTRFAAAFDVPQHPVPVDSVACDLLGLMVTETDDIEVSGLLVPETMRVYVNAREASENEGRRRFTIAHEIGHWELHADEVTGSFICRRSDVSEATRPKSAEQIREHEANGFAAELLMPAARVHADVARHGRDVVAAAKRFEVSTLAMAWRLYNLKHISRKPQRHDYGL